MSRDDDSSDDARRDPPSDVPADLASRLAALDGRELRAVISYAQSLSTPAPSPAALVEERPGERILDVRERDGHTEVLKEQPCPEGCDDCPHGPYLYRIRVRPPVDADSEPTLRWDFVGPVDS
ncbi:hypothetical protein [Halorussus caseinilyticus]|uniref:Uncharacterized protein n=1 Tax=Halorussus caseinilyticus TaxID=3034025 RepID=A0ABD5WMR5_9EURY|nr:hypothetical protein [Halorussus sp. DT72]